MLCGKMYWKSDKYDNTEENQMNQEDGLEGDPLISVEVAKEMKNHKAIEYGRLIIKRKFYWMIKRIWEEETISGEWKVIIICPIYKKIMEGNVRIIEA